MHLVTVSQVLTQLGRTPGASGEGAGGAEDDATGAGAGDEPTAGGTTELAGDTGTEDTGGAAELPCWTGAEDAGGAAELGATGATHLVQMVEMEVLVTVETVVETCWNGVPCGGVMVLVTGQVVKVW